MCKDQGQHVVQCDRWQVKDVITCLQNQQHLFTWSLKYQFQGTVWSLVGQHCRGSLKVPYRQGPKLKMIFVGGTMYWNMRSSLPTSQFKNVCQKRDYLSEQNLSGDVSGNCCFHSWDLLSELLHSLCHLATPERVIWQRQRTPNCSSLFLLPKYIYFNKEHFWGCILTALGAVISQCLTYKNSEHHFYPGREACICICLSSRVAYKHSSSSYVTWRAEKYS